MWQATYVLSKIKFTKLKGEYVYWSEKTVTLLIRIISLYFAEL